jgi:hypothetical protein
MIRSERRRGNNIGEDKKRKVEQKRKQEKGRKGRVKCGYKPRYHELSSSDVRPQH